MKCIFLGTGHAIVTHCYNTCFVLEEQNEYFLVDTGGGGQILTQLEKANVDICKIKTIFITHKHTDHIMGVFWMIRMIGMYSMMGKIKEPITLYAHDQVISCIQNISKELFSKELNCFEKTLLFVPIQDMETKNVLNHPITFFDIQAKKEKQFGFIYQYDSIHTLVCAGDEPLTRYEVAQNATYLMHEAFCLYRQKEIFKPERAGHSTALQACQTGTNLHVQNMILYHTEDSDMKNRKENYTKEGQSVFKGNIYVPDDLEVIEL